MRVIEAPQYEFTQEEADVLRSGCSVFHEGYRYFMLADGELLRVPSSAECLYMDEDSHNLKKEDV